MGRLVNILTLLLIGSILSRNLTIQDYGLYHNVWLLVGVGVPLFLFGLPVSINYFISPVTGAERDSRLLQHVIVIFALACLFLLVGGGIWMLHGLGWLRFAAVIVDFLPFAVAIGFGMIACGFWEPFLVIYGRHKGLAASMLLFSALHLAAVLGGWFVGGTLWWIFACLAASVAIRFCVSFAVLIKVTQPFSRPFYLEKLGEVGGYVWQVGIRDGLGVLAKFADKLIFVPIFTQAQYAVYINGAWEVPAVVIIVDAMVAVLLPELRVAFHRGDLGRMRELMHFAARRIALLLFPVAAGSFMIAPEMIVLLFGEPFRESGDIFRILVLLVPFRVSVATFVLLAAGQTKAVLIGTMIDLLLAVTVGLALIPWLGMWGPAVALLFSTFCQVSFYLHGAASVIGVTVAGVLPWRSLGRLALLSCGVAVLSSFLVQFDQAVANVFAAGCAYLLLLLLFGYGFRLFDAEERELVSSAFAVARGKLGLTARE